MWRFLLLSHCTTLKRLDCALAEFLEFINAHIPHASSSELIDEEFLCCCERARHAIKDFTNQGSNGKVSDCFPVAYNALRDLQWCLGKLLRHGYEGYEMEADLYMRQGMPEIETNLKELNRQLVEFLESKYGQNISHHASSSKLHKKFLSCCERVLDVIKDFTNQEHDGKVSDRFSVAWDALRDLQLQISMFNNQTDMITAKKNASLFADFVSAIERAMDSLMYQSNSIARLINQTTRQAETGDCTSQNRTHNESLLSRFLKRQADVIWPTEYQHDMSLTFFQQEAYKIKSEADIQIGTEKYQNMLRRFHKIEMYHKGKGRDPILLNEIEKALYSLGLPETSLHDQQGPSGSRSIWDARNASSSVNLPPGLNVDDIGEIHYIRTLGEGSQGMVYEAVWGGQKVAVKEVGCGTRSEGLEALESVMKGAGSDSVSRSDLYGELDVLKTLNHPNIVELNGYTNNSRAAGSYGLVMELMEGSLADLMLQAEELSELVKVDTLLQVARGMQFLHRVGIMHRDLKPANILIKQLRYFPSDARRLRYVIAKLADFGLSKPHADSAAWHSYKEGTSFYMAPEVRKSASKSQFAMLADVFSFGTTFFNVLKGKKTPFTQEGHPLKREVCKSRYAMSADVFSFGTTCFNVLTGQEIPFTQEGHPLTCKEFYRLIEKGDMDQFNIHGRSKIALLVRQCWCLNPKKRPTFFKICQILEDEKREILCPSTPTSQVSPL